ncbi:MAG: YbhB/YbcL family Raf kinase inhibitor-like protein [Anaerolineae bacterium]|nr:YbhB/YbcL family Raf kinase inhibitor-like protein [Anaerolineae bacterium]
MKNAPGLLLCVFALLTLLSACGTGSTAQPAPQAAIEIAVESEAFNDGATIPVQYTCDGADISPPLTWSAPPSGTESLVLIVEDPDAPGDVWTHWVAFNIPPGTHSLPEAVSPDGAATEGVGIQGKNCWQKIGYGGPCPPEGSEHRYFFRVYALDTILEVDAGSGKKSVQRAMEGHILAQGELMGRYAR